MKAVLIALVAGVIAAALWWWLRRRELAPGESFTLYVLSYAVFRFLVEFVRGNEVAWHGLTRPQLVLAVALPVIVVRVVLQGRRGTYRSLRRPPTAEALRW